jgi:hypothetical protein
MYYIGIFIVIFGHNIIRANLIILGVWASTIVYSHRNSLQDIFHCNNVRQKIFYLNISMGKSLDKYILYFIYI